MNRKEFIRYGSLTSTSLAMQHTGFSTFLHASNEKAVQPLAITMCDFSWLERRWPGAGYEDWDKVLNELLVRGYNAVRIDAYPHLVDNDATKEYTLLPVWNTQDWGSPDVNKVMVQPALNQFIAKCKERGIMVGLSCSVFTELSKTGYITNYFQAGIRYISEFANIDILEKLILKPKHLLVMRLFQIVHIG